MNVELQAVRAGTGSFFIPDPHGNIASFTETYTVNDSGSETNFWSVTLPGKTMINEGDAIHIVAHGIVGNSTNAHQVNIYVGSVTIKNAGASQTLLTTTANDTWAVDLWVFVDSANGGNSLRAVGFAYTASGGFVHILLTSTNITWTSDQTLKITARGVASAPSSYIKEYVAIENFIAKGNLTP